MLVINIENKEVWKDVIGYEGLYEVSSLGRVRSLDKLVNGNNSKVLRKGIILKPQEKKYGYLAVNLYKYRKMKSLTVHRLVAKAFIENLDNKPEVNHIDGNKKNNSIYNLEWVTSSENQKHAFEKGLQKTTGYMREVRSKSATKFGARSSVPVYQTFKKNGNRKFWISKKRACEVEGISITSIDRGIRRQRDNHKWIWDSSSKFKEAGFVIIVEGCDCSGKTTLIKELHDKTGFEVVKGSDFKMAENGIEHMYNYMIDVFSKKENIILDRSFISNMVYAPLFDKNSLTYLQISNLIKKAMGKSFTIYLHSSPETIKERLIIRGDDYIKVENIEDIIESYDKTINILKEDLEILEYSTEEYSAIDISKIIIPILKNMELLQ